VQSFRSSPKPINCCTAVSDGSPPRREAARPGRFVDSGDIPVEQATHFNFANNMNTAKSLGIKIPNSILVRADKGIE
jgi:hypothetical protein